RTTARGFRVIDSFSRITRLGEGLGVTGLLAEAAIARTIEALAACAAKITARGVRRGRYVATEACRRAANCAEFLDRVEAATGLRLSSEEHTSELQSREKLVCRLLLEKKQ